MKLVKSEWYNCHQSFQPIRKLSTTLYTYFHLKCTSKGCSKELVVKRRIDTSEPDKAFMVIRKETK